MLIKKCFNQFGSTSWFFLINYQLSVISYQMSLFLITFQITVSTTRHATWKWYSGMITCQLWCRLASEFHHFLSLLSPKNCCFYKENLKNLIYHGISIDMMPKNKENLEKKDRKSQFFILITLSLLITLITVVRTAGKAPVVTVTTFRRSTRPSLADITYVWAPLEHNLFYK